MTALLMVALIVLAGVAWQRIATLERRVAMVENFMLFDAQHGSIPVPAPGDWPEWVPAPDPRPEPPLVSPAPGPAPLADNPPAGELAPEPVGAMAAAPARRFGFEDIFGRYLPIWAGGITLAVAGFLIVKYSIDSGLLSPAVRVVAGLLFGGALIAGAEVALRRDDIARDPRIRQALAGAGIATLYASALVAANLYHLIGPMTAFTGLAAVTIAAAILSLRFGAPSAVLGLIGGLAAPALVGSSTPDIPLLSTYLALTVGGLSVLGRAQRWWWLGAFAILGGFGWGLLLVWDGLNDTASLLSVGTLTLLLSIGLPLAILGDQGRIFRLAAAVAGCAQMATIVALGGFAPIDWTLYGLISVALIWLSRREPFLRDVPVTGLGVGMLLTLAWSPVDSGTLGIVLASGALIYGVPALLRVWRPNARLTDAIQLALIAAGTVLIPIAHYAWTMPRAEFAPPGALGAVIAGGAAAIGWRNAGRHDDSRFATLSVGAILLSLLSAGLVLPAWSLAPAAASAAVAALLLGRVADDFRVRHAGLLIMSGAIVLLVVFDPNELLRAAGFSAVTPTAQATTRWAIGAIAAATFAWRGDVSPIREGGSGVALALAYVAAAQVVPPFWLALVPAAMLVILAVSGERVPLSALVVSGALSVAWAVQPLAIWLAGAGASLAGLPLYMTALPGPGDVAIRIAAPAAALIVLLQRRLSGDRVRAAGVISVIALGTVAVHVAWKHVFALADWQSFVAHGMAERTLWEALLLGASVVAWRIRAHRIATGLGVAGLLHFMWFTASMHNPLWSEQAAGIWLIPAYGLAFVSIRLSRAVLPDPASERVRDGATMALILLLAASLLRQAFHGSILSVEGVTEVEDICRSLLAIGIAIGFLQWGIRRAARDWRIASLILMLGSVGKVFLFDAAGLDGLMRIGSFAALGFSLIGVGWLYSRYLPDASGSDALTQESQSADTVSATHGGN